MNNKVKEIFTGKVVNKAYTLNTGVDEFPRYVLEYLIDNYCSEDSFYEDMEIVVRRLKDNFVHGAEAEKIRHFIKENRQHTLIANLEVRLVETEDKYWASIGAINESFINIPQAIVSQYPMLLSGGMWGTIDLTYDETEVHGGRIRPFKIISFTPFQISVINIDDYIEKRKLFTTDEWINLLMNSCGINPNTMNRKQKLHYLCRCIPIVESNVNLVELAPRETGKTYLYRNISYYTHVLSGGKATPAQLFINLNTGKVGMVGTRDVVVFDEIANTDFTDPKSLVSIMQGYMQDAKFSRGKKELLAFASLVFVGNLDVQGDLPHEKYYHLFEPMPDFLQVPAFIDRIHGYLPGWEIPKITPTSYSKDYGFITDYFCEIMHGLRRIDMSTKYKKRFDLVDTGRTKLGKTGRDERAVQKTLSGLVKLLYPDGNITDEELEETALLACELRQRVRHQLHLMAPGEYERVRLGIRIVSLNKEVSPVLPDSDRIQKILPPAEPSVGEVVGLAVEGDHGTLLLFEMQATQGSGRIVALGSIQRVMKESIEAAAQYVRSHYQELGISKDWRENFDVHILAAFMGIPKEGPSAGVAMVTGIVSALLNLPVRNDLAMTGEITIMGKVLPIGGILEKIRAAYEAGIKEVLLPEDNLSETRSLPNYLLESIKLTPITTVDQVIEKALLRK